MQILDDPHGQPATDEEREKANKWINETIKTRKGSNATPTFLHMRLHECPKTGKITLADDQ